jgi:hypothetical protein
MRPPMFGGKSDKFIELSTGVRLGGIADDQEMRIAR